MNTFVCVLRIFFLAWTCHVVRCHVRGDNGIKKITNATSAFSQKLYQNFAVDMNNVVYSPFSIHTALAMVNVGARGDTVRELHQTLGLTFNYWPSINNAYRQLLTKITNVQNVALKTANAVYLNPAVQVIQHFKRTLSQYYLSTVKTIALNSPEGPEKDINDYVSKKTDKVIVDFLPKGTIDNSTTLLLISTVHFKGVWLESFSKSLTSLQNFHLLGGNVIKVSMMSSIRTANMKKDRKNSVDVLELPFQNPRFALYIAVPQSVKGIRDLETLLTRPGKVNELFTGLQLRKVNILLPKFRIQTSISLKEVLQKMGVVKAFDPTKANFTGISRNGVFLSKVLHKALIDVSETGTVASAATAVVASFRSMDLSVPIPFIVDRPFMFFLRESQTQAILFQGKYSG